MAQESVRNTLPIVVSQQSMESEDASAVVQSSISFVNALMEDFVMVSEQSSDAMTSYYVDYYLAQMNNGGFGQFVFNSRLDPAVVAEIRFGLAEIGAREHGDLLQRMLGLAQELEDEGLLQPYFASEYFGDNTERERLDALTPAFFELSRSEDIHLLNAAWIRARPNLMVLTLDEMYAELDRRVTASPGREERMLAARANEPIYVRTIRRLCEENGHELSRVTAGSPTHTANGQPVLAWHFLTEQGHFYMVDDGGTASMFADGDVLVGSIPSLEP